MPATMVDTEVIRDAVRLACRAPSLHNSQPWRWVAEGDAVQLFVDPGPRRPRHRRSGREALIGCGAATRPLPGGDGRRWMDRQCRPVSQPQQPPYIWRRLTSARWTSSPTGTANARTPFCGAAPTGFPSPRRQTGIRSSRSCATVLPPTPCVSTQSPTNCVRSWPKRLSSPNRFASTTRRIMPNSLVDSRFRSLRRYSAQFTGIGGRKRPRRRRTHLPGDPPSRAAPGSRRRPLQDRRVVDVRRSP